MSTSSATGIVVAEIHAEREQPPGSDDSSTSSRQPSATAAAARLPPEGPSLLLVRCQITTADMKLLGSLRHHVPDMFQCIHCVSRRITSFSALSCVIVVMQLYLKQRNRIFSLNTCIRLSLQQSSDAITDYLALQ